MKRRYSSPEKLAQIQASNRRWAKNNWPRQREINKRTAARQPEKVRARWELNNAIRKGLLTRLPCERCGDPKSQGHHDDYSKPLDVHWMCRRCHWAEHRKSAAGIAAAKAEGRL
jgi:hypothetical protein